MAANNTVGQTIISLTLDRGDYDKSMSGVEREADSKSKGIGGLISTGIGAGLGMGIAQKGMGLIGQAFDTIKGSAIGMNASLQTTTLQFTTLMGNADEAQQHVKDLFTFAKKTPFETGPVIQASKMMETFGGKALDTNKNLTLLGDAAAATNAPIDELGFWVGRMYAAIKGGQPFGEAAMRLQELAVMTPEARQKMEDLQKSGASADVVFGTFQDSLGKFSGAMERQAGTWEGLTSTFQDTLSIVGAKALAPFFTLASGGLAKLNDLLGGDGIDAAASKFASLLGGAFAKAGDGLDALMGYASSAGAALHGPLSAGADLALGAIKGLFGIVTDVGDYVGGKFSAAWDLVTGFFHNATRDIDSLGHVASGTFLGFPPLLRPVISILGSVLDTIHFLGDGFTTFKSALAGNWVDTPGIAGLHRVFGTLGNVLRTTFEAFGDVERIGHIASGTLLGFPPILRPIAEAFNGLLPILGRVGDYLKDRVISVMSIFSDVAKGVSDVLHGNFRSALGDFGDILKQLFIQPLTDLGSLIFDVFNMIDWGKIAGTVLAGLGHIWDAIAGFDYRGVGETLLGGILDGVTAIADVGKRALGIGARIFGWVKDEVTGVDWGGVGSAVLDGIETGFGAVLSGAKKLLGFGERALGWITDEITGIDWGGVAHAILSGITAGFDAVVSGAKSALGFGIKAFNWVKDEITSVDWGGAARAVIDGITNAWGTVASTATDIGKKVYDWVKAPLAGQDWAGIGSTIQTSINSGFGNDTTATFFQTLLGNVQGLIDLVGPYLTPTIDNWREALDKVSQTLDQSVVPITQQFHDLMYNLKPLLEGIGVVVGALVGGALIGLANALAAVLPDAIKVVTGSIQGFLGIIQLIADTVVGVGRIIKDVIDGDWTKAWDDLKSLVSNTGDDVINIIAGFGTSFKALIKAPIDAVVGFFQGLYDTIVGHSIIPDLVNGITSWITTLRDNLVGLFRQVYDNTVGKFQDLWGWISGEVSQWGGRIYSFLSGIPGDELRLFQSVYDNVTGKLNDLWNWMSGTIPGWPGDIWNWFSPAIDKVRDIGQSVYNEFSGKLNDLWNWMNRTIPAWKDDIWNWIKDIPQTFWDIGDSAANSFGNALNAIGRTAQDALNKGIDVVNTFIGGANDVIDAVGGGRPIGGIDRINWYARGGLVDRPQLAGIGEDAPKYPEFVIPTNPAYKDRALALIAQLAPWLGADQIMGALRAPKADNSVLSAIADKVGANKNAGQRDTKGNVFGSLSSALTSSYASNIAYGEAHGWTGRGGILDVAKGVLSGIGTLTSDVTDKVKGWISEGASKLLGALNLSGPGALGNLLGGVGSKMKDAVTSFIQDIFDNISDKFYVPPAAAAGGAPAGWDGNYLLRLASTIPGVYGWCEKFVGDVMDAAGLHYSRFPSAEAHAHAQGLNPGFGPAGAVVFFPWNTDGHVAFSGGDGGSYFGTVPEGTGWRYNPGWTPYGWTVNPAANGLYVSGGPALALLNEAPNAQGEIAAPVPMLRATVSSVVDDAFSRYLTTSNGAYATPNDLLSAALEAWTNVGQAAQEGVGTAANTLAGDTQRTVTYWNALTKAWTSAGTNWANVATGTAAASANSADIIDIAGTELQGTLADTGFTLDYVNQTLNDSGSAQQLYTQIFADASSQATNAFNVSTIAEQALAGMANVASTAFSTHTSATQENIAAVQNTTTTLGTQQTAITSAAGALKAFEGAVRDATTALQRLVSSAYSSSSSGSSSSSSGSSSSGSSVVTGGTNTNRGGGFIGSGSGSTGVIGDAVSTDPTVHNVGFVDTPTIYDPTYDPTIHNVGFVDTPTITPDNLGLIGDIPIIGAANGIFVRGGSALALVNEALDHPGEIVSPVPQLQSIVHDGVIAGLGYLTDHSMQLRDVEISVNFNGPVTFNDVKDMEKSARDAGFVIENELRQRGMI